MSASRVWRLILDGPCDGAWNMGVDRVLLEALAAGHGAPTLRIYGWDRPTVSLGRFQDEEDVDAAVCAERGVGIVRRPTGGLGVLHDREVTYSVTAGVDDGLPRGVRASYAHLSAGLVDAYRRLGVDAQLVARHSGRRTAACYLLATPADLVSRGAKLSGSAQVWRDRACLQHGSVVLERDLDLEAAVFRLGAAECAELAGHAASLEELLGEAPTWDAAAEAVVAGFGAALGVDFELSGLSAAEENAAREPAREAGIRGVRGSR